MESRLFSNRTEQEISLHVKSLLHQKFLMLPRHLQTHSYIENGQRIWAKGVTQMPVYYCFPEDLKQIES